METPASCTQSSARPTLLQIAAIIYLAAAVFAAPVRAGNIFDDDWTPPKPAAQPKTAPSPAPESPPNPTNPSPQNPPVAIPPAVGQPSAAPAPPARREIPGKVEQARSRGLLKQAFADQLKDRTLAGRKKLAQALLDEVPKTADNSSDAYVLLGGAIEASKESGHLKMCFQAADILASQYDIDGLNVKIDAVLKVNLHGDSSATAADNVQAALDLVDSLVAAEDFTTAGKVLKSVRTAATGDQALLTAVQKRMAVVESRRLAHDRVTQSLEKLKASPNDPAANFAVGSYFCFDKAEWENGLPLLAKGSDASLKQAATLELSHPIATVDVVRLADDWWDIAAKQPEALRAETMHHAAGIYAVALKTATGLQRTVFERRIAAAAALPETAQSGVIVELLSEIDLSKDYVAGDWKLQGGVLRVAGPEAAIRSRRVQIPAETHGSYDLTVEFERTEGNDMVAVFFPVGEGQAMLALSSWGGAASGIHDLDGKEANNNATTVKPGTLDNGRKNIVQVRVRIIDTDVNISVALNGKPYMHWNGAQSKVIVNGFWGIPDKAAFGVAVGRSIVSFTAFKVRMTSGELRLLRPKSAAPTP